MAEVYNPLPNYWPTTAPNSNYCASCNAWVGPDHRHGQPALSVFEPDSIRRIASALERIAAALERSDGR